MKIFRKVVTILIFAITISACSEKSVNNTASLIAQDVLLELNNENLSFFKEQSRKYDKILYYQELKAIHDTISIYFLEKADIDDRHKLVTFLDSCTYDICNKNSYFMNSYIDCSSKDFRYNVILIEHLLGNALIHEYHESRISFDMITQYVVKKESVINLGEEFEAKFVIAARDTLDPYYIVLEGDTFDKEHIYGGIRYTEKPTKRGLINKKGQFIFPRSDRNHKFDFEFQYRVK